MTRESLNGRLRIFLLFPRMYLMTGAAVGEGNNRMNASTFIFLLNAYVYLCGLIVWFDLSLTFRVILILLTGSLPSVSRPCIGASL